MLRRTYRCSFEMFCCNKSLSRRLNSQISYEVPFALLQEERRLFQEERKRSEEERKRSEEERTKFYERLIKEKDQVIKEKERSCVEVYEFAAHSGASSFEECDSCHEPYIIKWGI